MENWPYAILTHNVKQYGGPVEFVNTIVENSRLAGISEGKKEMIPVVVVVAGGTLVVGIIIGSITEKIKKEKEKKENE